MINNHLQMAEARNAPGFLTLDWGPVRTGLNGPCALVKPRLLPSRGLFLRKLRCDCCGISRRKSRSNSTTFSDHSEKTVDLILALGNSAEARQRMTMLQPR